jgi:hypothetical protein
MLPSRLSEYEKLESVAAVAVRDGQVPEDLSALRRLLEEIEALLDVEFDLSPLDTRRTRLGKALAEAVAVGLFVFMTYIVIGGLLERQSALLKAQSALVALVVFAALLALLAVVEALHISVTLLRLKDLNAVKDEFPRTYLLHRIFQHERGTRRFLAGRQLMVIITVFLAAQITSFPHMHTLPGTKLELPTWFRSIFLERGIAGALFVLWFGQLTPQFVANKTPKSFMNHRSIEVLFRFALFLESLGLARPGEWLSRRIEVEPQIPLSPQERYRQAVEEIEGVGTLGVKKVWKLSDTSASLVYERSTVFARAGFQGTSDHSLSVHGDVENLRSETRLLGADGTARALSVEGPNQVRTRDGRLIISQAARPRIGTFQPRDVLLSKISLEFHRAFGVDVVSITEPTKYVMFRVVLGGSPESVDGARVQGFKGGDAFDVGALAGRRPFVDEDLALLTDDDGAPYFEYAAFYPDVNTHYVLAWEAAYYE